MVMDGDADIIFFNQLIKAFKTIRLRVRADIRDTGQLGELEDLLIGLMVFAKGIHSMGAHAHVVLGQLGIHLSDLRLIRRNRVMPPEKLNPMQPQIINLLQGPFLAINTEGPQRIALDSHRETPVFFKGSRTRLGELGFLGKNLRHIKPSCTRYGCSSECGF